MPTHETHLPNRRSLAKRRASLRKRSEGAVMFVVVTTLGLLGVMGMYAMSTTTQDIRASANLRRASQAQLASDFAAVAAADYITYDNADYLVNTRMLNPSSNLGAAENNCLSTQKNQAGVIGTARAKSCVRISKAELRKSWNERDPFTSQSFGDTSLEGDIYIELTNPMQAPAPPGYDVNLRLKFAMVTVTTFGILRPYAGVTSGAAANRSDSMQMGRGRFVIGPLNQ